MLLIGGYSQENGFNHHLLEFNAQSGNWTVLPHTGTPPTGKIWTPDTEREDVGNCVVLNLEVLICNKILLSQVFMDILQSIMSRPMLFMFLEVTVSM